MRSPQAVLSRGPSAVGAASSFLKPLSPAILSPSISPLSPSSTPLSRNAEGRRLASTNAGNTDWVTWLKRNASSSMSSPGKALLFAGLGSYPHTPSSPTASSLKVWDEASDALLSPDATIGYETRGMSDAGLKQVHGWMRGWVEGRSLEELMKRPDVTAAFILTSSLAILASAKEKDGTPTLLPEGTTHLVGHGFIGTLTALVAAGRLDLATGVRLARIYTSLPPQPPRSHPRAHLTTVLSARHFHSLSSPSFFVPPPPSSSDSTDDPFPPVSTESACDEMSESSSTPLKRRRAMQLILDEIHSLQRDWEKDTSANQEWASAGIINSSKVLVVSGTHHAVLQVIERLQHLNLANPVMDVHMPPTAGSPIILDPMTTHPIADSLSTALIPHLTAQLRWHKTLYRLYSSPIPEVSKFITVGKGAKGLGIMLRGETRKRPPGAGVITIEEMGVPVDERTSRAMGKFKKQQQLENAGGSGSAKRKL
ncbi:hypothetical protein I317_06305 [Kwoniella heveanensis CBS 569]|nr:hypothetical protein I317_06305 [Kwoniella heveanensis CBS 569]